MVKYIVTHSGGAHRDEILAVALALNVEKFVGTPRVYRRDPNPGEFEDPQVLVLDVGLRHEPTLNNFDHHQMEPKVETAECALSLYAKARGLEDSLRYQKWYRTSIILDACGPFKTAGDLGLPRFPMELLSPIESVLIDAFQGCGSEVNEAVLEILAGLGKRILAKAKEYVSIIEDLKSKVKIMDIAGVQALVLEQSGTKGLQDLRDDLFPQAGISILHDDRGDGWILYRFNDDRRVDFSLLGEDPRVLFAHKGGFIAKTLHRLPLNEVVELAAKGVIA